MIDLYTMNDYEVLNILFTEQVVTIVKEYDKYKNGQELNKEVIKEAATRISELHRKLDEF